jgi:hypothetical protein
MFGFTLAQAKRYLEQLPDRSRPVDLRQSKVRFWWRQHWGADPGGWHYGIGVGCAVLPPDDHCNFVQCAAIESYR